MADKHGLENFPVNLRIKLSLLWTSVTLCYLYGDYFELYVPQKVEGLIDGKNLLNSPEKLFAASVLLAIPATMVFLSVLAKPFFAKWLNIICGIFFSAIMLLIAITSIDLWLGFYVFLAVLESIITSLIVWQAWRWPLNKEL